MAFVGVMKITRVIYYDWFINEKILIKCSIIFEDCLKLNDIRLGKNDKGYFLILPSKQDIYNIVSKLNDGRYVEFPKNELSKQYEEFYHPLNRDFYLYMLNTVVEGYDRNIDKVVEESLTSVSYYPD